MRKVVNVNGKKIYVYRKGHEMKHLGRTFVRLWKEGKVNLPTSGRHSLGVDRNGKISATQGYAIHIWAHGTEEGVFPPFVQHQGEH